MRDSEPSVISSSEDETRSRRNRGHTGASEIAFSQIDNMLHSESYRKIIMLQKELRVDTMEAEEGKRWTENEPDVLWS